MPVCDLEQRGNPYHRQFRSSWRRCDYSCSLMHTSGSVGALGGQPPRATRPADEKTPQFIKELVDYGAGHRAGQNLILGGKAMAAMDGRFSVAIDDVQKVAEPVLRHRISTNFQAQAEGKTSEDVIQQLLATVGEPEPPKYEKRKK